MYKHTQTSALYVENSSENIQPRVPQINSHQDFPQVPATEKRLVGNKTSIVNLMQSMNQMVILMNQTMNLITNMMNQKY